LRPTEEYAKKLGSWAKDTDADKELRAKIGFAAHDKKESCSPQYVTVGWTDCGCGAGFEPGIVLDPFMGAGTTALVARKSGRDYIGIELNQEYKEMAENRIKKETEKMALFA